MDCGEEVAGGLVVSGSDRAKLLEFGKEVFDQMARCIEMAIEVPGQLAIGLRRDHGGLARRSQRRDDPLVCIKGFISDQRLRPHVRQEVVGTDQIMSLATGREEANRVAQGIDQSMDLGAQPATRATDCLALVGFFLAPALC